MKKIIALLYAACIMFAACESDNNKDTTKPQIIADGVAASPTDCDSYAPGDTIEFCYRFTDDCELGSYNIEIHSNFDHHSHSTSTTPCEEAHLSEHSEHENEQGWIYNQDFSIPDATTNYVAHQRIAIPPDAIEGDYHFAIRLTDKAGWQEIKSIAFSIE